MKKKKVLLSKQNKQAETKKPPIKKGRYSTPRKELLIDKITENLGKRKGRKSLQKIIKEAGYSDETARQQQNILETIRPDLDPILQRLVTHREKVLEMMEKKVTKAAYMHLSITLGILTKDIQLLSGGVTDRPELRMNDDQFDRFLKQVNKRREK